MEFRHEVTYHSKSTFTCELRLSSHTTRAIETTSLAMAVLIRLAWFHRRRDSGPESRRTRREEDRLDRIKILSPVRFRWVFPKPRPAPRARHEARTPAEAVVKEYRLGACRKNDCFPTPAPAPVPAPEKVPCFSAQVRERNRERERARADKNEFPTGS